MMKKIDYLMWECGWCAKLHTIYSYPKKKAVMLGTNKRFCDESCLKRYSDFRLAALVVMGWLCVPESDKPN